MVKKENIEVATRGKSLEAGDFKPFLEELAKMYRGDSDLIRRAKNILDATPAGSLSGEEVERQALKEQEAARREFAKETQLVRCIR